MTALEIYHLRKYCRKYGLDFYEVDSAIGYWENKEHLESIVKMLRKCGDMFEIARMEDLQAQYIAENPLTYYAACQLYGETKSSEVGDPDPSPQRFSLRTMSETTEVDFSLQTIIEGKSQ